MTAALRVLRRDMDGAAEVHDAHGLLWSLSVDGSPSRRLTPAQAAQIAENAARAYVANLQPVATVAPVEQQTAWGDVHGSRAE